MYDPRGLGPAPHLYHVLPAQRLRYELLIDGIFRLDRDLDLACSVSEHYEFDAPNVPGPADPARDGDRLTQVFLGLPYRNPIQSHGSPPISRFETKLKKAVDYKRFGRS